MKRMKPLGILLMALMFAVPCKAALTDSAYAEAPAADVSVAAEETGTPELSAAEETGAPEPTTAPEETGAPEPTIVPEETGTPGDPTVSPEPSETPEATVTPTPTPVPKGLVKVGKRKYCFYKKGVKLKKKWKTIAGRRYYFKKNGYAAIGSRKISGQYRVFNNKGQLLQPKTLKIVSITSGKYCVDSKGRPRTGWQVIGSNLYSVKKTGKVRTNTTYQGIKFDKSGKAQQTTAVQLKIKCMQVLSSITSSNMTSSQKLRASWGYVTGGSFWYASKYPNLNVAGWQKSTALNMLTTHSGNCYSFACAFAALAKEIGYNPVVVCGRVPGSRDGAGDGMTRHAWVMINGLHYDPEGQYAGWLGGVYGYRGYPISCSVQRYVTF